MGNFEVYGDQKTLTQWDVGRKVAVAQKCDYIHFANAAMSEAVACKVRENDGVWIADIPDEVLQVSGVLRIYAFVVTAGENYTKWSQNLFIRARPKPENYLYTPTTGVSWEAMIGRVEALEEKTAQKPVYTAEEVGARPDTWMPSASEVGAAPAGYGLGEQSRNSADVNAELTNGYFRTTSATANSPFNHGAAHVRTYNASEVVQNIFRTATGIEMVRYTEDGGATWIEEYVNPTMNAGSEYRTFERWQGEPVYTKLIDFGALPNSASKTVATGIDKSKIVRAEIMAKNGAHCIQLPYFLADGTLVVKHVFSSTNIQITTTSDYTAYTGHVHIWYTK